MVIVLGAGLRAVIVLILFPECMEKAMNPNRINDTMIYM